MKIRKVHYNIDYIHILTFKEQYKNIIYPYFAFENVSYVIENENTIHERMRLIFNNEKIALFIRKEGISFVYEGDAEDLKDQNGVVRFFWDIYEKIKNFNGYSKASKHTITAHAVEILEKEKTETILKQNPYLVLNPFGELLEFACVYEYKVDEIRYKFHFGNFSERDIKVHDLSPFKSEFNSDLAKNVGLLCLSEITKPEKSPSYSKFKSLLVEINRIILNYKLPDNGK